MKNRKLGKRIVIPSSAEVGDAPTKIEYYSPHIEVIIGIGKDHTASLIMDVDAWEELKKGTPTHV